MRSDPYRNIRHGMGVPLYMPSCHTLTDYFRHMQSRPESLYILPRVYGIMVREGCNTSVPPGAGGLIPPSHLVKGGMLQGGVPLQRRYSRGQGVCLPLLPFPLTMRVLGNTRLIFLRKPNSALPTHTYMTRARILHHWLECRLRTDSCGRTSGVGTCRGQGQGWEPSAD